MKQVLGETRPETAMEEALHDVTVLQDFASRTSCGDALAEATKKHEVSDATIYAGRKHIGQMRTADVKRLRTLELESSRLKQFLAERDLDLEILKEINAKHW